MCFCKRLPNSCCKGDSGGREQATVTPCYLQAVLSPVYDKKSSAPPDPSASNAATTWSMRTHPATRSDSSRSSSSQKRPKPYQLRTANAEDPGGNELGQSQRSPTPARSHQPISSH